jgi:glutamate 5-kinase
MTERMNVEKLGSSLVANGYGVDTERLFQYAQGFAERYSLTDPHQREGLVIVTSGARATGLCIARELGYEDGSLSDEQLSGMGFAPTFAGWQTVFAELGVAVTTTGATHHQLGGGRWWHRLANRQEKKLFVATVWQNGSSGVLTIVNEPDMTSNTELMRLATGGDNDGLGGQAAAVIGADTYTIRTKNGGVFDDNHELIECIDRSNLHDVISMLSGRGKSEEGRGGMDTKVAAAWYAGCSGVGQVAISAVSEDMSYRNATRFVVG